MEIVVLVENSLADARLQEEFGLSLMVKTANGSILFDMGSTDLFEKNSEILGEDLSSVECAVVSHAHYDHGGGLSAFMKMNGQKPIYVGTGFDGYYYGNIGAKLPSLLEPFLFPFVKRRKKFSRYVGIDRAVFSENSTQFITVEGKVEIVEGAFLLQPMTDKYPLVEGNKYLLEMVDGKLVEDRFKHELILVVRESDGVVLFTGCGHRSIANMIETVKLQFPDEPLKALVGGFHLAPQPGKPWVAGKEADVRNLVDLCKKSGVQKILTGHCTGGDACEIFSEGYGDMYFPLSTGLRYTL